jgi:hypothetical protein
MKRTSDSRIDCIVPALLAIRRHMMHQIRRWNLDHSEEFQIAWKASAATGKHARQSFATDFDTILKFEYYV